MWKGSPDGSSDSLYMSTRRDCGVKRHEWLDFDVDTENGVRLAFYCPRAAIMRPDPDLHPHEMTEPRRPEGTDVPSKPKKKEFPPDVKWVICRHCASAKVNRPRGLCWGCYYTPGVKEQYDSTSKYAHRGVGHSSGQVPLDDWGPTVAIPGSEAKLKVLTGRAKRNVALFHPADALYPGDDARVIAWFREVGQSSETKTAA